MQLHMRSVSDPFDDYHRGVENSSNTTRAGTTVATAVLPLPPSNNNRNGWIPLASQSESRSQCNSFYFGGGGGSTSCAQDIVSSSNMEMDSRNNSLGHIHESPAGSDNGILMVFFPNVTICKYTGCYYWGLLLLFLRPRTAL